MLISVYAPWDDARSFSFALQVPSHYVTSIIDGLKKLYVKKLKPLEVAYHFSDFVSPLLVGVVIMSV